MKCSSIGGRTWLDAPRRPAGRHKRLKEDDFVGGFRVSYRLEKVALWLGSESLTTFDEPDGSRSCSRVSRRRGRSSRGFPSRGWTSWSRSRTPVHLARRQGKGPRRQGAHSHTVSTVGARTAKPRRAFHQAPGHESPSPSIRWRSSSTISPGSAGTDGRRIEANVFATSRRTWRPSPRVQPSPCRRSMATAAVARSWAPSGSTGRMSGVNGRSDWSCSRISRRWARRRMTALPSCGCPRDCMTRWNGSSARRFRSSPREVATSNSSSARTGAGRRNFLKALAQWASERGCVTAYVDCQRPFESLVETYRAIAAGMTPPGTNNLFATTRDYQNHRGAVSLD